MADTAAHLVDNVIPLTNGTRVTDPPRTSHRPLLPLHTQRTVGRMGPQA